MKEKHFIRSELEKMGIRSYNDYLIMSKHWLKNSRYFYVSTQKIKKLRKIVLSYEESLQCSSGQYISIDPNKCNNLSIDNYICMFPKRSLIETNTLMTSIEGPVNIMPPNDFMKQFFRYEKLIQNNIAYLYPVKEDEYMNEFGMRLTPTFLSKPTFSRYSNIAKISQSGDINRLVERSDIFYLAMPWLYNAKTDDYIDICNRYPLEFDCLANSIEKIAIASNAKDVDMQPEVLYQLKEALINIQISYESKKAKLKTKGIETIAGIALTCIPYTISHFFDEFDPALLQTIIGGATIASSIKILDNFNEISQVGKDNPFWVIWKWKNMNK